MQSIKIYGPSCNARGFRPELHGLHHGLASHLAGGGAGRGLGTIGRVEVAVDDKDADRNDRAPESPTIATVTVRSSSPPTATANPVAEWRRSVPGVCRQAQGRT